MTRPFAPESFLCIQLGGVERKGMVLTLATERRADLTSKQRVGGLRSRLSDCAGHPVPQWAGVLVATDTVDTGRHLACASPPLGPCGLPGLASRALKTCREPSGCHGCRVFDEGMGLRVRRLLG